MFCIGVKPLNLKKVIYLNKFIPISPLMLSADNKTHIQKISKLKTDTIILNLEDGVGNKRLALENCKMILRNFNRDKIKFVVRVNALDNGGVDEILEINKFNPDAIRVPKIRYIKDIEKVVDLVSDNIDIHLSIETKEAWLNLAQLKISPKITNFYLGLLDLVADLGMNQSLIYPENATAQYMLSHFLITTKALGVNPISFVFQDYKNRDQFLEWLKLEKSMGYISKGVLSPTQADDVKQYLAENSDDLDRAKYIKDIFENMSKDGINGFSDEKYGFIDEPIYKGALAILDKL